jgi:holo-[acyl-carrier protein] synthase
MSYSSATAHALEVHVNQRHASLLPNALVVHGVDIVEIDDFRRMLQPELKMQLSMIFTEGELKECESNERVAERLAGRFATKEAVLKALRLGFGDGVAFLDVETVNEEGGAPKLSVHRLVAQRARDLGVDEWLVSTSHTSSFAVASIIGTKRLTLP